MAEIQDSRVRPDHLAIHSILTGFLAFEGFVNLVGAQIAPDKWSQERDFFSRGEFRGILGKVDYLFTLFSVKLDKGIEPYQTVRRIKQTRDHLAHNRVHSYGEVTEDENPSFRTKWDDFDTPEKVLPALQRLKELAEMIRVEAVRLLKEDYQVSHLHFIAFEGPLGTSEGNSIKNV
jgi:hypothetical protein